MSSRPPSRLPAVFARLMLLVASICIVAIAAEVVLQVSVDRVNFLRPVLVDDPMLGHRVRPDSAGHDAWGYRNAAVPEHVSTLVIGDSQTYGVSAMASGAYPAWLARISGRSTYNMALGGYGPIQYAYLLETRGAALSPDAVVVGLYFGNDLFDAYRVVYGLDHWKALRDPSGAIPLLPYKSVERDKGQGAMLRARAWLSRNSILYRIAVTALGQVLGRLELSVRELDPGITVLDDGEVFTAFTPARRFDAVDPESIEVEEGMRLTLDALDRMQARCREMGARFIVVLIPTKEAVFEERLRATEGLANAEELERLFDAEARARARITAFLAARGVPVVDPRASMRRAALDGPIYPSNEGGHPISSGYRAIAESIAEVLDEPSE